MLRNLGSHALKSRFGKRRSGAGLWARGVASAPVCELQFEIELYTSINKRIKFIIHKTKVVIIKLTRKVQPRTHELKN